MNTEVKDVQVWKYSALRQKSERMPAHGIGEEISGYKLIIQGLLLILYTQTILKLTHIFIYLLPGKLAIKIYMYTDTKICIHYTIINIFLG